MTESSPIYPLSVDPTLWVTLLVNRPRPPQIPARTWYHWTHGASTPPISRLQAILRYIGIPVATALEHLGWGGLPGVASIPDLQRWVADIKVSQVLTAANMKAAQRAAAGLPPCTKAAERVQLHRDRKAYLAYLKGMQPNECDADGKPIPNPVLPVRVRDVVLRQPIRRGPLVRPPEDPKYDYKPGDHQ